MKSCIRRSRSGFEANPPTACWIPVNLGGTPVFRCFHERLHTPICIFLEKHDWPPTMHNRDIVLLHLFKHHYNLSQMISGLCNRLNYLKYVLLSWIKEFDKKIAEFTENERQMTNCENRTQVCWNVTLIITDKINKKKLLPRGRKIILVAVKLKLLEYFTGALSFSNRSNKWNSFFNYTPVH